MIEFQLITHNENGLLKEIVNSNREYNILSEGHFELTDEEILKMYESSKVQRAVMNLVVAGGRPVGVIVVGHDRIGTSGH